MSAFYNRRIIDYYNEIKTRLVDSEIYGKVKENYMKRLNLMNMKD